MIILKDRINVFHLQYMRMRADLFNGNTEFPKAPDGGIFKMCSPRRLTFNMNCFIICSQNVDIYFNDSVACCLLMDMLLRLNTFRRSVATDSCNYDCSMCNR